MPALPADIAAVTRPATIITWADAAIAARYPSARDGSVTTSDGFCDNPAHSQALINARGALIGAERGRHSVEVHDIVWPDLSAGMPQARLVDGELQLDRGVLLARIEIDLEAEVTALETFG